jgi:hypothetical protein
MLLVLFIKMFDKSIFMLMATLFMTNTIYGLASPFLPTRLEEAGVNPAWTGLIFAMYAIA